MRPELYIPSKLLSLLKAYFFDLGLLTFHENSNHGLKTKDMQFFMENLKMKRKKDKKKYELPERGFEPQIFSNFSANDMNCHGK